MKIFKQIFNIYTIIIASAYGLLLILYFNHFESAAFSDDNGKWGTFGDFLGGSLSPIIGLFTVYLTYKIIYKQTIDTDQNEFRNMFQILFQAIPEEKKEITINRLFGDKAVIKLNNDIDLYYRLLCNDDYFNKKVCNKSIQDAFRNVHEDSNDSFAPFMKNIHNLLKFIDLHCLEEKRNDYADLLRAQFNKHELLFIFYNSLASKKYLPFKERLKKFDFLKDVLHDNTVPESLKDLYLSPFKSEWERSLTVGKYVISIKTVQSPR